MAVAVDGVDMSLGPVGERGQALKHYFFAGRATQQRPRRVKAGSWARWVSVCEARSRFLPVSLSPRVVEAPGAVIAGQQPVEGDAETGLFRREGGRPWASQCWSPGTRAAGRALEEEWDAVDLQGQWTVVTGTMAVALDHLERRLDVHGRACSAWRSRSSFAPWQPQFVGSAESAFGCTTGPFHQILPLQYALLREIPIVDAASSQRCWCECRRRMRTGQVTD